jgi:hypothetical protein
VIPEYSIRLPVAGILLDTPRWVPAANVAWASGPSTIGLFRGRQGGWETDELEIWRPGKRRGQESFEFIAG